MAYGSCLHCTLWEESCLTISPSGRVDVIICVSGDFSHLWAPPVVTLFDSMERYACHLHIEDYSSLSLYKNYYNLTAASETPILCELKRWSRMSEIDGCGSRALGSVHDVGTPAHEFQRESFYVAHVQFPGICPSLLNTRMALTLQSNDASLIHTDHTSTFNYTRPNRNGREPATASLAFSISSYKVYTSPSSSTARLKKGTRRGAVAMLLHKITDFGGMGKELVFPLPEMAKAGRFPRDERWTASRNFDYLTETKGKYVKRIHPVKPGTTSGAGQ
ncbi:hypothetical protein H6P81_003954 [Aristolochia fimbriata]|uniref:Uncharacterized protein n=1 Tax=Aristolochia fimbriata TaxID=158543 RepID=A0AAV7FGY0_ARIFI|nr:hypothetical protein H6P81_003954 [Aristolochia fimbriata]